MKLRVLSEQDAELIKNFELENLSQKISDEHERVFASWKARWRDEALNHYLKLGWSLGVWKDNEETEFLGYFLGQVLLFYRGMTQNLWIEHLSAVSEESRNYLLDSAYRYSREKHLQRLIYDSSLNLDATGYKHQLVDDKFIEIFTSKANS